MRCLKPCRTSRLRGHRTVPRSNLAHRGRTSATHDRRATQPTLFFPLGRTCIRDDRQIILLWRCAKEVRALQARLNDQSDGFAGRKRWMLNPSAGRREECRAACPLSLISRLVELRLVLVAPQRPLTPSDLLSVQLMPTRGITSLPLLGALCTQSTSHELSNSLCIYHA